MAARLGALVAVAVVAAGCASIPPVTARYYLPKAETQLAVTQTLGCTGDGTHLVVASAVSAVTAYSADTDREEELSLRQLGGTFVDADTAMTFSSDGQLMSINGTSTGQGATVVRNAVTLANAAAPLLTAMAAPSPTKAVPKTLKEACAAIASFAAAKPAGGTKTGSGDGGTPTVSLIYTLAIAYKNGDCPAPLSIEGGQSCLAVLRSDGKAADGSGIAFTVDPDSRGAFKALSQIEALEPNLLPVLKFVAPPRLIKPAADAAAEPPGPSLTLSKIAALDLEVDALSSDFDSLEGVVTGGTLWTGRVRVPVTDAKDTYRLPLPDPKMFGKENFALSLNPDGSIAKLEYGNASGAADMLSAFAAAAQAAEPETTQQRASSVQSQADLIYEQQRLVACQTNPKTCSSK